MPTSLYTPRPKAKKTLWQLVCAEWGNNIGAGLFGLTLGGLATVYVMDEIQRRTEVPLKGSLLWRPEKADVSRTTVINGANQTWAILNIDTDKNKSVIPKDALGTTERVARPEVVPSAESLPDRQKFSAYLAQCLTARLGQQVNVTPSDYSASFPSIAKPEGSLTNGFGFYTIQRKTGGKVVMAFDPGSAVVFILQGKVSDSFGAAAGQCSRNAVRDDFQLNANVRPAKGRPKTGAPASKL